MEVRISPKHFIERVVVLTNSLCLWCILNLSETMTKNLTGEREETHSLSKLCFPTCPISFEKCLKYSGKLGI